MNSVNEAIKGYAFGDASVAMSPVTPKELESLKTSVGFSCQDVHYLLMAGEVLSPQTRQIVEHWRSKIIAGIPHLARHSRALNGAPLPNYLANSNRRFEQWILDTCLRAYDQRWLDYQREIALRHTSVAKNRTDQVESTPFVPLRDIIAFTEIMNETIKPYLAARGHAVDDIEKMHQAWRKSLQLQLALWAQVYADKKLSLDEW